MKNRLTVFENEEFGKVRSVVKDGEIWFVAADVCRCLELSNTTVVIERLDDDERSKLNLGRQGVAHIVNEYGLYNLVLGSRKPEAKAFKRWITHDVIPSIRKTGAYGKTQRTVAAPSKRDEIMMINAQTRRAKLLQSLADNESIAKYKEVLLCKSANIAAGEELLKLPRANTRERHNLGYFCTLIGKTENWASVLGKKLHVAGIKKIDGETGEWVEDKAKYNDTQRKNFEWYDDYLLPILRNTFGFEVKQN